MKKDKKRDFTKLTQKKGISLIVLIVTIIVIIILAAAVILTLGINNPVESAREAKFKEDVRSIQDELSMYLSSKYTKDLLNFDKRTLDLSGYDMVKELPSSNGYDKIFEVVDGELVYIGTKEEEKGWVKDLEIAVKGIDALTVSKEPKTYYGKYVLNYSTGNSKIDENVDWRIFYSDGKNIYLIAADYVKNEYLPKSRKENLDGTYTEYTLNTNGEYQASFTNVLEAYKGSINIIDSRLQELNSSYYAYLAEKQQTSKNNNMKAVAYMMDTRIEAWGTFVGNKAEYAIGGPTIEMVMKSYSQKIGVDYRAKAISEKGYQVSKDGGKTWEDGYSEMLSTTEDLYVITSDKKANGIWIASPSANSTSALKSVYNHGRVSDTFGPTLGFRPLVCLKSGVELKDVGDAYEIML